MRLDKFLKISRIIKRRTLAKEVAEAERIYVNDRLAKPSKELKVGDIVLNHKKMYKSSENQKFHLFFINFTF